MSPRFGAFRSPLRPLLVGFAVVASSVAGVASADESAVRDNRNTSANLLDIRVASASDRGDSLRHTIRTYRSWRSRELRSTRRTPRLACIYIWRAKSDPDEQQDYEVCSRFRNGALRGSVFHARPPKRRTGRVHVRRVDSRSVTYRFEKRAIGNPRSYHWQAVTGYTGRGCPRDPPFRYGCDDSAPTGAAEPHTLGAAQGRQR